MVFSSQLMKSQEDIVQANTEARPDEIIEVFDGTGQLPGVKLMHTLNESERIALFMTALKMRSGRGNQLYFGEFTYGKDYVTVEETSRVPKNNQLHILPYEEVANILVGAMLSNSRAVGVRFELTMDAAENVSSKVFIKVAKKAAKGPKYDEFGSVYEDGDSEFAPTLTLKYK